jgi:arabinosaccharide transport system substrate-binding protein
MSFHLGKPILVMIAVALLTGAAVWERAPQRKADLTLWVFADSHYRAYQPLVAEFERQTGTRVNLNLIAGRALTLRLASLFMSDPKSSELPDLVEIEIGWVGQYFRPPVSDVGFLPLNDLLVKNGWYDKIVPTRYAPWSKEGVIFGVPHDVHPTTISYRKDLFDEAGVDLSAARTWPAFQEACLKFQDYWKKRGVAYRHAIELNESAADMLQLMLLQRHINPVDDFGKIHMADPLVAKTMAFYTQLVTGPRSIAGQSTGGQAAFTKDLNEGNICAYITPDWRVTYLRQYASEDLRGKMHMMPMPIFEPGDSPTATWGGTMIGIPRGNKNPNLAWKLLEFIYFSRTGIEKRREETDILPPIRTYWTEDYYHHTDYWYEQQAATRPSAESTSPKTNKRAIYGDQKAVEMLTELAGQIPPRYVTPATAIAQAELSVVLNLAVDYYNKHGTNGLEEACQGWLEMSAADLQRRMEQWRFPDEGR